MLQKQNQRSIRQDLQMKLFSRQVKKLETPKQQPKRAIRVEDPLSPVRDVHIETHGAVFREKYKLGPVIGQGAHAIVREALQIDNNYNHIQRAVKICQSGDPEIVKTFIDGFKNNKLLNNEFILQVHECFVDEGMESLMMVMDYVNMSTLERILQKKGKISEQQTKAITKSLLTALVHCHEVGIAHRDIKPDNILIRQGQKYTNDTELEYYPIKLIDFGVSRKYKNYAKNVIVENDMWTRTGNDFYCAPEIYHGGGYDEKIDVWAVGVCVYQMLSGRLPFYDDTRYGLIDLILTGNYSLEGFSPIARDFLRRVICPNPKLRLSARSILLSYLVALQHPWFCFKQKYEPISPESERMHRNSADIHEHSKLHQHQRSNTSLLASVHSQPNKSPVSIQLDPEEFNIDTDNQSPLIKLKKMENKIKKQIHIAPRLELGNGLQRIKMRLHQI